MEASAVNPELKRLLDQMAAGEEEVPDGFYSTKELAAAWGISRVRASDVLNRAVEQGFFEARTILRKGGFQVRRVKYYREK